MILLKTASPPTITELLKGSGHALTIFGPDEVACLQIFDKNGKPYLKCLATDKERPAKPGEIVRQLENLIAGDGEGAG